MATRAAAKSTGTQKPTKPAVKPEPAQPQVPASRAMRAEIRLDGRIRLSQQCYNPQLSMDTEAGTITFTASLEPVLVDAPPVRAPELFGSDPRDGDEVIQQIHSGRRT